MQFKDYSPQISKLKSSIIKYFTGNTDKKSCKVINTKESTDKSFFLSESGLY